MPYLIAIAVPLILLALFLMLTAVEGRTGKRVLAGSRYRLDMKVGRTAFVLRHVDWGAFAGDLTRTSLERLLHDIAHGSLIAVRALERELTRLVRTLRTRRDTPLPAANEPKVARLEQAKSFVQRIVRRSRKQPAPRDTQ